MFPTSSLPRRIAAFTMTELLVVIATIALLASLLMPALGMVREHARSLTCANHLRQVGMAERGYGDDWNGRWAAGCGPGAGYWNQILWNYIGQREYWPTFTSTPQVIAHGIFTCPSFPRFDLAMPHLTGYGMMLTLPPLTSAQANDWSVLPFSYPNPLRLRRPSVTPLVADSRGLWQPVVGDWHLGSFNSWCRENLVGYVHRRRANLLLCDMHVQTVARTDAEALAAQATYDSEGTY